MKITSIIEQLDIFVTFFAIIFGTFGTFDREPLSISVSNTKLLRYTQFKILSKNLVESDFEQKIRFS